MNARKIYPVAHQSRWEYRLAAVTRSGAFAGLEIPLEVGADSLRDAIRAVRAVRTYPASQYSLRVRQPARFL